MSRRTGRRKTAAAYRTMSIVPPGDIVAHGVLPYAPRLTLCPFGVGSTHFCDGSPASIAGERHFVFAQAFTFSPVASSTYPEPPQVAAEHAVAEDRLRRPDRLSEKSSVGRYRQISTAFLK